MRIVLVNPEIPQNTGNIARTCAALAAELHLVRPLGFSTDERSVRRAGVDYWHLVTVHEHASIDALLAAIGADDWYLFSAHGTVSYTDVSYGGDPVLVFGPESNGLPAEITQRGLGPLLRIPTVATARSLNLSNSVAVAAYEVARQNGFADLAIDPR